MNPFTLLWTLFASMAKFVTMFSDVADAGIAGTSTLKQYAEHQAALTQLELDDELAKATAKLNPEQQAVLAAKFDLK